MFYTYTILEYRFISCFCRQCVVVSIMFCFRGKKSISSWRIAPTWLVLSWETWKRLENHVMCLMAYTRFGLLSRTFFLLISMFLFHISYIHHHGQAMITLCYIGALGIQKMGRMGEEEMNKSSFVCMFMWRLYRKFEKKCWSTCYRASNTGPWWIA